MVTTSNEPTSRGSASAVLSISARSCPARAAARACDLKHGRLRIHADDPSDIRGKAEGEQSRTRAEIDQRMLLAKPQPFHDSPKNSGE
jgi:hypothetical protein